MVFFANPNFMEFQVGYLALFRIFSVRDGFKWFCMGSPWKSIQLMLEFLKAPLVLHFAYYTSMNFQMILSVILLFMLMIISFTLSVIRHLVYGNCYSWLLNLNLTCNTFETGAGKDLLISMLKKLNLFRSNGLITLTLLMWKCMNLFLKKYRNWRCRDSLFLLNWVEALTLSIAKTASKKMKLWSILWSFFLLMLFVISTGLPYGLAWNNVVMSRLSYYLYMLDKLQKPTVGLPVLHLLPLLNLWVIVEIQPA